MRKMIETAEQLVANRKAPGSGVIAPSGRIDDTGRVELFIELPAKTSGAPEKKKKGKAHEESVPSA